MRKAAEALRQASNNDMYRFLRWCLLLERSEDGRHYPGINKASTLETDWKNLRLYYQKLTKIIINDGDGSEIRRVRHLEYILVQLDDLDLPLYTGYEVFGTRVWFRHAACKKDTSLYRGYRPI